MAKFNHLQTNFSSGELSPLIMGRVDISKYNNGCATLENFIAKSVTGAHRRPGTYYVATAKNNTATRIISFQFSVTQSYIIELGNYYMRFYMNGGQIVMPSASSWVTSTAYVVGNYVMHASAMYYCIVAHTSGTFATDLAAGKWVLQSVYEIPTPYAAADLFNLQFAQNANTLYIAHNKYPPMSLTRSSHTSWTLSTIAFTDGPYMPSNILNITLGGSATTGSITVTAKAPAWGTTTNFIPGDFVTQTAVTYKCLVAHLSGTFATDLAAGYWVAATLSIFQAGHVGSIWEIGQTNPGWVRITAVTNGYTATATVMSALPNTSDTTHWSEGSFSAVRGYPGSVTFYEQRLAWAATIYEPQTVYLSVSQDYLNMTAGANDSDALVYTISANDVNAIKWLYPSTVLLLGTAGGVYSMSGGASGIALTPTNVLVQRQTRYGSAPLLPQMIGNDTLFVDRSTLKVRELVYNFTINAYQSPDLTILSEHITQSGIVDLDYQESPDNILWCVRADGQLCALTRQKEQEVIAWHRHTTEGGSGLFKSISVIPNGEEDQVWVVVQRVVNSVTVNYIEYFNPQDYGTDQEDAFFVDCGLTYDSTPATTFSGLTYLKGKTVSILGDGAVYPDQVVPSNGIITINKAVSVCHIGLPYDSTIVTVRPEGGSRMGSSQGIVKRIYYTTLRLWKSLGFKIGLPGSPELDTEYFRDSSMKMDQPPLLFTGDKGMQFPGGYNKDGTLTIVQSQPLPLNVLAVTKKIAVADE